MLVYSMLLPRTMLAWNTAEWHSVTHVAGVNRTDTSDECHILESPVDFKS